MQLDWFTVSAQIVNFLILVYLLKRFLYRPILDAMDDRQAKIEAQLKTAKEKTHHAETLIQDYRARVQAFEATYQQRQKQAREEVDRQRREWLDAARREVDETKRAWQQDLERELHQYRQQLSQQLAKALCDTSWKILTDLADVKLERQIANAFVQRLHNLSSEQRQRLVDDNHTVESKVSLYSTFELDDEERDQISTTINNLFGRNVSIAYHREPELGCGIALRTASVNIEWSIKNYCEQVLERLEAFNTTKINRRITRNSQTTAA